MQLSDERLDLLIACMRSEMPLQEVTRLRGLLLSDQAAMQGLLRAAERRHLLAAAVDGLEAKGIGHPASYVAGTPSSFRSELGRLRAEHEDRRAQQGQALYEIIGALNAHGIEPLIIKGAVSLLTGIPSWRHQRDLDFAIDPGEAEATMAVLRRLGFSLLKPMSARHHHLDCMARGNLPVVVEPHIRINGPRAARALADFPMVSLAEHMTVEGLKFRVLRNEHALIHAMVHHHFENRGKHFGVISLKGLLEFAHDLDRLDAKAVTGLVTELARRPRLRIACEIWLAAAEKWLGVALPEELTPSRAAYAQLSRMTERLYSPDPASIGAVLREDIVGLTAVAADSAGARPGIDIVWSAFAEMLGNRPWGGRARALKAAGLLTLYSPRAR